MTSSSSLPQDAQDAQSATENTPESLTESLRADALMEEDVAWSQEIDGARDGDQLDRSERAALRRVAGLSTEARGRHRGRIPTAAPGARRAGRCLDLGDGA